jgi:hypothetical protein
MVKVTQDDVMICTDCMMYIANGELPEDNSDNWSPKTLEQNWKGYQLCLGDSDKDDEFSTLPCEGCSSRFAGARFHCVALED